MSRAVDLEVGAAASEKKKMSRRVKGPARLSTVRRLNLPKDRSPSAADPGIDAALGCFLSK